MRRRQISLFAVVAGLPVIPYSYIIFQAGIQHENEESPRCLMSPSASLRDHNEEVCAQNLSTVPEAPCVNEGNYPFNPTPLKKED